MIGASAKVDGALASLQRLRLALTEGTVRVLEKTVAEAKAMAQSTTSFQDRPGALRGSLKTFASGWTGDSVKAGVRLGTKYGTFIENGTRAHPIVARSASRLRFVVGGRVVFARAVMHPGTAPRHFMRDTETAMSQVFDAYMHEMAASATSSFGR